MFERNNKVTNFRRAKFIELVLDVFQLLIFKKLHCAITRIIEQVTHQKGFISTKGNQKFLASGMQSTSYAINLVIS